MKLRTSARLASIGLLCATALAAADETMPSAPDADKAAAAAAELGKRLKQRLVSTMQSEGPVAAIDVCAVEAPEIASEVSAAYGLDVGRTAVRVRNPANQPDAREREVLEAWLDAIYEGTPTSDLPVHVSAGDDFLWMKPIAVAGPCLACHGETLSPAVAEAIASRYPDDAATGFKAGDLRGAFVVRAPGDKD